MNWSVRKGPPCGARRLLRRSDIVHPFCLPFRHHAVAPSLHVRVSSGEDFALVTKTRNAVLFRSAVERLRPSAGGKSDGTGQSYRPVSRLPIRHEADQADLRPSITG